MWNSLSFSLFKLKFYCKQRVSTSRVGVYVERKGTVFLILVLHFHFLNFEVHPGNGLPWLTVNLCGLCNILINLKIQLKLTQNSLWIHWIYVFSKKQNKSHANLDCLCWGETGEEEFSLSPFGQVLVSYEYICMYVCCKMLPNKQRDEIFVKM